MSKQQKTRLITCGYCIDLISWTSTKSVVRPMRLVLLVSRLPESPMVADSPHFPGNAVRLFAFLTAIR